MYLLLLLIGGLGFLAMTAFGIGHGLGLGHLIGGHGHTWTGHSGGAHGHSSLPAHGHSSAPAHGQAHHVPSVKTSQQPQAQASQQGQWRYLMAISPLDIFAMAFGAGAVGEILKNSFSGRDLMLLAVLGALVFDFVLIRPLMGSLLRFASKPSSGLEGQIASLAEAVTRFDLQGRGMVKLTLDGQQTQLMATLDASELANHVSVAKGDKVVVVEVDPATNICRVSRELAPSDANDAAPTSSQTSSSI